MSKQEEHFHNRQMKLMTAYLHIIIFISATNKKHRLFSQFKAELGHILYCNGARDKWGNLEMANLLMQSFLRKVNFFYFFCVGCNTQQLAQNISFMKIT